MEEEFEYIYMNYPEMLGIAMEQKTEGLTWEQRVRSWYHGVNPNEPSDGQKPSETIPETSTSSGADNIAFMRASETSEGGEIPPKEGSASAGNIDVSAIQRVVETEYHRMYNTGAWDYANSFQKETGRTMYKRWETMLDDKVRDTHMYLQSDAVPLDEAFFTFDGDSAMYPGGFTLAQNNCGCRCWVEYETA